ncbi:hypothetical protein DB30_07803 [Enhygromyxa salina]|uniref:Outer membrane lipoprotein Blc n=1 Tax=Enhygromyxa salina TaxID=215803 RepID=A0A0C2A5Y3_9BACT|nr:hypothetical protein [Enhygromyxa salina]KIG18788.1 hypothetical protein DB30_07803 [Enhygromyxa salina]
MDVPEPATEIDPGRLLGAWYVLVSNYGFWRRRAHARIDYDALAPTQGGCARVLEARRFRAPDLLGRPRARLLVQTGVAERPGTFCSRGTGSRLLSTLRFTVVLVDPSYQWTVTWYARSNFGAPPGLSIHTRDPWISQARLDQILTQVRAHPFLRERCGDLFAPEQHWIPPQPFQLD